MPSRDDALGRAANHRSPDVAAPGPSSGLGVLAFLDQGAHSLEHHFGADSINLSRHLVPNGRFKCIFSPNVKASERNQNEFDKT